MDKGSVMKNIRQAEQDDVKELSKLLTILFSQEAEFKPDNDRQVRALSEIIKNPASGQIFVMTDNKRIIGMVSLLFSISTAMGERAAFLEDMIIHPDYRNRNNGSELIEYALSYADENSIKRITLLTDSDNKAASSFYEKHGFEKSAMVPFRKYI